MKVIICIAITTIIIVDLCCDAYNISPLPSNVFKQPDLNTFLPKSESTMFGYSLNLRKDSIMIGAPKSQSHLASQRLVNETGAVYKCDIRTNRCLNYVVDTYGNKIIEYSQYHYDSEKKDFQLLGYAMDGASIEQDKFLVCAPNLKASLEQHYLLHGVCYLTSSTLDLRPVATKIAPLRNKGQQISKDGNGNNIYQFMYGQSGFSVYYDDDSASANYEEFLIGAPGVYNWKGSVIRYRVQTDGQTTIDVINPVYSDLPDDSYFGFAVASANFFVVHDYRKLYVASAPQANKQSGEVYIFDFIHTLQFKDFQENAAKIYYKFSSGQMGEYFGYSLVIEDVNNDGLPDVLIGAPMFSKNYYFESGAVYLYMNKGKLKFDEPFVLTTSYEFSGRFGTTIAKLGDINLDGCNDIAIGAPFEENGVVYIYHGSNTEENWLKPVQKLEPETRTTMFGHSISRGVDIDANNYNDFAIGAPGSEQVFIYRSFPIVDIHATIRCAVREIRASEKQIQLTACWMYVAKNVNHTVPFRIELKADVAHDRAKWINNNKVMVQNATINNQMQCHEYDVGLKYSLADIFEPITFDMEYEIVNDDVTNTTSFCDTCVVVNPSSKLKASVDVIYSTGCKKSMCEADLVLESSLLDVRLPFVLGSSKTIGLVYNITNLGETAYLAQIQVQIGNSTSFARIPSDCLLRESQILCNLNQKHPLFTNETASIIIHLDTTVLAGREFIIDANISSAGIEINPENNQVSDIIELAELTALEIYGKSSKTHLNMKNVSLAQQTNLTQIIKIFNVGPSIRSELNLITKIPATYYSSILNRWLKIVENVTVQASYLGSLNVVHVMSDNNSTKTRQRRDIETTSSKDLIDHLPEKKSIIFSCHTSQLIKCSEHIINVNNFQVGQVPVIVTVNFSVHPEALAIMESEAKDLLMVETGTILDEVTEDVSVKISVEQSPYFIIFRSFESDFPWLIVLASSIAGLLLLGVLSYALQKLGFFQRKKLEELEKLTQTSQGYVRADENY